MPLLHLIGWAVDHGALVALLVGGWAAVRRYERRAPVRRWDRW